VGLGDTLAAYQRRRLRQHTLDSYAGISLSKFPEDLRVYEHLLWMLAPDAVIELGCQFGGSALWFRDRLASLARYGDRPVPRVIAVDVEIEQAHENLRQIDPGHPSSITLIEGDVRDPELSERVARELEPGARCLVVEDTAHTYETTLASLSGFSRFVNVGGLFVVEDGCVDVDELRISYAWPRGVLAAIREWLGSEGHEFVERSDLELYGVTCHPHGFLQRRG
jgi:cephalosporin hydroxylase